MTRTRSIPLMVALLYGVLAMASCAPRSETSSREAKLLLSASDSPEPLRKDRLELGALLASELVVPGGVQKVATWLAKHKRLLQSDGMEVFHDRQEAIQGLRTENTLLRSPQALFVRAAMEELLAAVRRKQMSLREITSAETEYAQVLQLHQLVLAVESVLEVASQQDGRSASQLDRVHQFAEHWFYSRKRMALQALLQGTESTLCGAQQVDDSHGLQSSIEDLAVMLELSPDRDALDATQRNDDLRSPTAVSWDDDLVQQYEAFLGNMEQRFGPERLPSCMSVATFKGEGSRLARDAKDLSSLWVVYNIKNEMSAVALTEIGKVEAPRRFNITRSTKVEEPGATEIREEPTSYLKLTGSCSLGGGAGHMLLTHVYRMATGKGHDLTLASVPEAVGWYARYLPHERGFIDANSEYYGTPLFILRAADREDFQRATVFGTWQPNSIPKD